MSRARQVSKTPVVDHDWEAGWVPLGELAPPGEPDAGVLVAVDVSDGLVVGAHAMPTPAPGGLARRLLQVMLHPATGKPRRPARLRVTDRAFADALASESGGVLHVEIAPRLDTLDAVAADLMQSLVASRLKEVPPLRDDDMQGRFFRTAAAFYNARPWRCLSPATTLFVEIEGQPRMAATVLGAANLEAGLSLFTDSGAIEATVAGRRVDLPQSRSVNLTFVPEPRAASSWRDLRRRRRWPIASPAAFPVALTHDHGVVETPGEHDLWVLDAALAAVASLVATHAGALERGESPGHSIEVEALRPGNGRKRVTVTPASAVLGSGDRDASPEVRTLEAVIRAAMSLPDASPTLARLAWSFYRDSGPSHVNAGDDTLAAEERFLTWGVFVARIGKRTLAERGLEAIREQLDADSLAIAKRLVRPRTGVFRVELAARSRAPGVQLHEISTGKRYFLAAARETVEVEPGRYLLGTVHPVGGGTVLLGDGCLTARRPGGEAAPDLHERAESFAPMLEEGMFGASQRWIESASPADTRAAYEEFRGTLAATGDHLPSYREFQTMIRRSTMPLDIFRNELAVAWWTETEVGVMMAFLKRIWNLTPRPELGGRSPDEMAGVQHRRPKRH